MSLVYRQNISLKLPSVKRHEEKWLHYSINFHFSSDLLDLKEIVGLNLHAGLRLRTVG
jgi:hypothetical protein